MTTTRYTTFNGAIVSENRGGVLHDYVPSPLGNTLALLDNTQTQTDQWSYMPYGEATRIKDTTQTPMLFVGGRSCRQDSSGTRSYQQHRVLDLVKGRWMTEDPIGFAGGDWNLYRYAGGNPVTHSDPSGLVPCSQPPPPNTCQRICTTLQGGYCKQNPKSAICKDIAKAGGCVKFCLKHGQYGDCGKFCGSFGKGQSQADMCQECCGVFCPSRDTLGGGGDPTKHNCDLACGKLEPRI